MAPHMLHATSAKVLAGILKLLNGDHCQFPIKVNKRNALDFHPAHVTQILTAS